MNIKRLLGATAVAALLSGAAWAQTPAAPAATPAPVTPAAAPMTMPGTPVAGQLVARGDIIETLKADGHFTTFVKALDAANMTGVLKTSRNLTVFAPTDAAFAALPAGELDRLMKSPAELQKLLTYHVINATVDSARIKGARGGVKTVAGPELVLDGSGANLMANNAAITQSDVMAANGTLHVVDKVLMPGWAPSMAATTGGASDAAATAPTAPGTPEPATPPETLPATPPIEDEPAPPEAPKAPVAPPRPQG
ncbi:MAG: fasciclin domain-containing protein [Caulobacter sp.]|nr:fasciclin domain-containing protein [Caulobacter sp.]